MTATAQEDSISLLPAFVPSMEVNPDTRAWCASHLADLPTRLIFDDREVKTQPLDGDEFRQAYTIVADPEQDREFRLYLFRGATVADLEHAKGLIEHAKNGLFNGDLWDRRDKRRNWIHRSFWARQETKRNRWGFSREVRACLVEACVKEYHTYVDGEFDDCHSVEPARHADDRFAVYASDYRMGEGWQAWASLDSDLPDGHEGIQIIRDCLESFERMQARCDELNAASKAVER